MQAADDEGKLHILAKWGRELGVLIGTNGQTVLAPHIRVAVESPGVLVRHEDVESQACARLFNARQLGRAANHYVDEVDRTLLAESLLHHASDPRDSVEKAGQALEDFLRHVARDKGFDAEARACNGATQLAGKLVSLGVLHSHHANLVAAVATVRNAKAHLKDKKTLDPWEISAFAAATKLASTLVAIRSIYVFVFEGKQSI
jgi:hypothetical protein